MEPQTQQPYYTLTSGHKMPMLGMGTDGITDPDIIAKAAIEIGYRTIDTAARYKNEEVVGAAVKKILASGVKREDLFVITKVWVDEVDNVEAACKKSLAKLDLEYVDLYLVHWPVAVRTVPTEDPLKPSFERMRLPIHKIWPQMEALVGLGLARSIGVSNFNV